MTKSGLGEQDHNGSFNQKRFNRGKVSKKESKAGVSAANRKSHPQRMATGLNLIHGAKFQRFLSGKSVFLNSNFQIREFHAH